LPAHLPEILPQMENRGNPPVMPAQIGEAISITLICGK